NHLALDHPWTLAKPERFVRVTAAVAAEKPEYFFKTPQGAFLAYGRDPYFPPWTDSVQVNHFSGDMRQAMGEELLKIAKVADAVRCDMAMLAMNKIFLRVWGPWIGAMPVPKSEFWPETIRRVKAARPDFLFLAEVYWNLEWDLQQMGFDYTYDKVL